MDFRSKILWNLCTMRFSNYSTLPSAQVVRKFKLPKTQVHHGFPRCTWTWPREDVRHGLQCQRHPVWRKSGGDQLLVYQSATRVTQSLGLGFLWVGSPVAALREQGALLAREQKVGGIRISGKSDSFAIKTPRLRFNSSEETNNH